MNTKKYYTPIDIARDCGIHTNTVRLYEKSGFVTPAQRDQNHYRMYTELHKVQFQLCRAIFDYPFTNSKLRGAGCKLLYASAAGEIEQLRLAYENYVQAIWMEIDCAKEAVMVAQKWMQGKHSSLQENPAMSRKELAELLGVTTEAIRNWERNGLIFSDAVGAKKEKLYSGKQIERTKVVYMLRQAGYSMSALHKCLFCNAEGSWQRAIDSLEEADFEEIFSAGDRWMSSLLELWEGTKRIPPLLEQIEKISKNNKK